MSERLGVDIGGVIMERLASPVGNGRSGAQECRAPLVPGALEALRRLNQGRFQHRIYVVSQWQAEHHEVVSDWLSRQHFCARTGIDAKHVRLCAQKADKVDICRELGITHFIDDRLEVLSGLRSVPHRYLFDQHPEEAGRFDSSLPGIHEVRTWDDVLAALL
jgi:hypothetical protein